MKGPAWTTSVRSTWRTDRTAASERSAHLQQSQSAMRPTFWSHLRAGAGSLRGPAISRIAVGGGQLGARPPAGPQVPRSLPGRLARSVRTDSPVLSASWPITMGVIVRPPPTGESSTPPISSGRDRSAAAATVGADEQPQAPGLPRDGGVAESPAAGSAFGCGQLGCCRAGADV